MVRRMVPALALAATLTRAVLGQGPPPAQNANLVFTTSVSSIPMQLWVKDKQHRPRIGLTAADFTLKIDGKIRTFAEVSELPDKPGYYLLNFEPVPADRDGKNHKLEIKVRDGGTMTRTFKLPAVK